jgi:hypothetical protein
VHAAVENSRHAAFSSSFVAGAHLLQARIPVDEDLQQEVTRNAVHDTVENSRHAAFSSSFVAAAHSCRPGCLLTKVFSAKSNSQRRA